MRGDEKVREVSTNIFLKLVRTVISGNFIGNYFDK